MVRFPYFFPYTRQSIQMFSKYDRGGITNRKEEKRNQHQQPNKM